MAEKSELIGNILDHGIDLKNRRIYFGALDVSNEDDSDFNWKSVERAVRALHILEQEGPKKPIELHMSSPGGDPYSLLRLYDAILACSCQIKFYGSGEISSAATWIMACCDERYLSPNAYVLIHDSGSYETGEVPAKLTDAYIAMDQERRMQERLNKIYAENSRMPLEFWDSIVKRDTWLTAEETIMLGLADHIVQPKKRGNLRKSRIHALKTEPDKKELQKLLKSISDRSYVNKINKISLHTPEEEYDNNVTSDENDETMSNMPD